jgi:TetR/AcrR family transcriptional repressor of nem operon
MTTRDQIVEVADRLFYKRGYDHTSFSDIAEGVRISRGNFYHHFKTKDQILDAVIAARVTGTRQMLDRWETEGKQPADRILSFIHILLTNRGDIKRYGCPVGTLCSELAKLDHAARHEANALFTLLRTWLRRQFTLLGLETEADSLALHVLARSQGIATLANAFGDNRFINREVEELRDWLKSCVEKANRGATSDVHRAAEVLNRKGKGRQTDGRP